MKKMILAGAIGALATMSLHAYTEEQMVIELKDGTTVEYNVENVEKVNFKVTEFNFTITPANGEMVAYATVPTLLRVIPDNAGDPTLLGFGNVAGATAEEIAQGEYGVYLSVSPSKIYTGEFDLAENTDSYTLKLVKYTEGGSEWTLDKVTSGTLSTKFNNKTRKVTLELEAVMSDGTAISAKYDGAATDVESIEGLTPAKVYGNEGFYTNEDGAESHAVISSVSKRYSSYSKATTFTITFDGYLGGQDEATIVVSDAMFESGEEEFDLTEAIGWQFKLGYLIQLTGPSGNEERDKYSNVADNGFMKAKQNEDGTYELFIEIQNYYNNYMGTHLGTPAKVILNYAGVVE